MIFKLYIHEDRQILQTDETHPDFEVWKAQGGKAHYDSLIMSRRGQDFDAVYNEIASNPEHEIVVIEDDE